MSSRIVTVISAWYPTLAKGEEVFVGVHDTFDSACAFVNEAINESNEKPTFTEVINEYGLQSTQIYEGKQANDNAVYFIREQHLWC